MSSYIPTIGIDYGVKAAGLPPPHDVRLHFFDMAGQAEYRDIRCEFYRDAHAAIFVYDPSTRHTFEALSSWLAEVAAGGVDMGQLVRVA